MRPLHASLALVVALTACASETPDERVQAAIAVKSFTHTGTLPAGRWTLFVKNTYNNFFRATIHVHATVGQ
jgi:hypothetical protein